MSPVDCNKKCKRPYNELREIDINILQHCIEKREVHDELTTMIDLKKAFKKTKRILYYSVNKLIKKGFLKNIENSVLLLEPTNKAMQAIDSEISELQSNKWYVNSFFDRGHCVTFNQPIIYAPQDRVPDGFTKSKKAHKLGWDNHCSMKGAEISIRITPGTVVYYFKKAHSPDPHHAVNMCLNYIFKISKKLQSDGFKLDLPRTVIVAQEHAIMNKHLAEYTMKFRIKYKSERMKFDNSIKPGEFELIHIFHAADDFLRLTDLFEAVVRGDVQTEKLIELTDLLPELKALIGKTGGKWRENGGFFEKSL